MKEYYYLDADQQQKGPIDPSEFMRLGITKNTLLWKNGMAGWQAAGMIPELALYFQAAPPTPPPATGSSGSTTIPPRPAPQPAAAKPDSLLIWSILSTVLCCLPLGIVAIVYSTRVDPLWDKGAYEEAYQAAKNAKTWCILSVVLGLVGGILAFFMGLLGAILPS